MKFSNVRIILNLIPSPWGYCVLKYFRVVSHELIVICRCRFSNYSYLLYSCLVSWIWRIKQSIYMCFRLSYFQFVRRAARRVRSSNLSFLIWEWNRRQTDQTEWLEKECSKGEKKNKEIIRKITENDRTSQWARKITKKTRHWSFGLLLNV